MKSGLFLAERLDITDNFNEFAFLLGRINCLQKVRVVLTFILRVILKDFLIFL